MRSVELHFHALPGLDDGPATIAESLELLAGAAADGTATVVATPHVRGDFVTDVSDLPARCAALETEARAAGIDVAVLPGAELGHDMVGRLGQRELESIAQGPAGARWLLVETPFALLEDDFHDAIAELRDRGFGVLIAHPERSADAALYGSAGLRRELAGGALAQINAQSVTGEHGETARECALALIAEGLVSAIASDAHGPTRPPLLSAAREALIAEGLGSAGRSLTGGGPRGLLMRGIRGRRPALVA